MLYRFFALLAILTSVTTLTAQSQFAIYSVAVNPAQTQITIQGYNFGTKSAPLVVLGTTHLAVTNYTSSSITANLPEGIAAGGYTLNVSCGFFLQSFDITIGVTGPQGPKGDTGLMGPKGDTGSQGVKGDTGSQGVKGDTGSAGPKGDTGSTGAKGDTGSQGVAGGQVWSSTINMPGSIYLSALGVPSGVSNGVDYYRANTTLDQEQFLLIPQNCTVKTFNVTVLGAQGTSSASVFIGYSTPDMLSANPNTIYVGPGCVVGANDGVPAYCSATPNWYFTQGTPITIGVTSFTNVSDFENTRIMTSFVCQ